MPTEADVLAALRGVTDPDLGRDIVELGFVKDLRVQEGAVSFRIQLTTPACPVREQLKGQAEAAVKKIAGVTSVEASMTASVTTRRRDSLLPSVRNIVAVSSGKGGVGKTTVAVNLAASWALDGARVGLMDLDAWGPNVPLMMGATAEPVRATPEKKMIPKTRHGVAVMSMGFFLAEGEPILWRGPMVIGLIRQFCVDVAWGDLDYLVIDLPPGTGDVPISMCQMIPPTGAVIVTTPQAVALLDAAKGVEMFRKLGTPILGVVENMSGLACPHCGGAIDLFGADGGRRFAETIGAPLLGSIPLEPGIRAGGDAGTPIVAAGTGSPGSRAFREAARSVAARVSVVNAQKVS